MSNRVKTLGSLGIAIIVIAVTLIIFLSGKADNPKTAIDWYALVFILISEVALFGSIIIISTSEYTMNKILITLGIVTTLFIYWLATVVISIFGMSIFRENIGGFVTTQIIICAIAAVITIILSMITVSVSAKDEKLNNSRLLMQDSESLAFSLKSNTAFKEHYESLNKLYEEIKFSDKTVSGDKENAIYSQIRELSDILNNNIATADTTKVSKTIDAIVLGIKERNLSVLKSKQGGF